MTALDSAPGASRGLQPARIPKCLNSDRRSAEWPFFDSGRKHPASDPDLRISPASAFRPKSYVLARAAPPR